MRTFFTEKQLWPIKIFSEHWSMSFERANIVPQNSCILRNWLSFQNPQTLSKKKQSLHHEKDYHRVIRWIFLLKFLYGWDFPSSHKVHTHQGKTLLRRLCVQWGLPLKSHECLQKISVFNTKYHLNLRRIYHTKRLSKHCTVARFYITFQQTEAFAWR